MIKKLIRKFTHKGKLERKIMKIQTYAERSYGVAFEEFSFHSLPMHATPFMCIFGPTLPPKDLLIEMMRHGDVVPGSNAAREYLAEIRREL